jgi:hypothetical protein
MTLNWNLSPPMAALVEALERLGGRAATTRVEAEASSRGENSRHGPHSHFGKAWTELKARGIVRDEREAGVMRCLTETAWAERGHDGPPPRSPQEGLF